MPYIDKDAYIAEDAAILGDVTIGKDCSVWNHVTIRADRAAVTIGEGSNIQDNAVIHMDSGLPVVIGQNVTIGHSAIVHGAVVGDGSLVGMGAILMNGSVIGKNCIIGAGSLITQNTVIPDGSLVLGAPAKVVRQVTPAECAQTAANSVSYIEEARRYREAPPKRYRAAEEASAAKEPSPR
ncbi:gamma carbonic anhydrase family protein [Lachnoclostridium sp. Marseille-P6806]|uniref:gamma carbonic anhydrase family protein n=1 Tax=Lachnoclostridium sp. Marseille-P6806 TaxID=2364793 RepID=UPI001030C9F5|nr:gamma carbonic anhydrase family protein [Lachnoclostridium sp. Marseille-P6806]